MNDKNQGAQILSNRKFSTHPQPPTLAKFTKSKYSAGFHSDLETDLAPKGLNEDIIKLISAKKNEPKWLLDWRLEAFGAWQTMLEPHWANVDYKSIDYQNIIYYAAPKKKQLASLDEVDPEVRKVFDKLGIPIEEQKILSGVAIDAILDSVSVATTFKAKLNEIGIIFCPISEAINKYPKLVRQHLGSVVGYNDNFFACLNSVAFTDGTFVYIPKGIRCPMELSTYFRINASGTGQFERTLIIAEEDAYVSYLEGCTAPQRDENQLHAAVVEIVALKNSEVKYSTVQNWYPGDKNGVGGIYNFVTKRGLCKGKNSKISWTQVETGSAITWKYPSVILQGDNSTGEFYSIAVTNNHQQADTGTKMIHLGKETKSKIVSKSISAGKSKNTFRSLVKFAAKSHNSRNYTRCDSLILNKNSSTFTFPEIKNSNDTNIVEHEATTSKVNSDILFYCRQRGFDEDKAINLIINGYTKEVLQKLPMEFAVEAQRLLEISIENGNG